MENDGCAKGKRELGEQTMVRRKGEGAQIGRDERRHARALQALSARPQLE